MPGKKKRYCKISLFHDDKAHQLQDPTPIGCFWMSLLPELVSSMNESTNGFSALGYFGSLRRELELHLFWIRNNHARHPHRGRSRTLPDSARISFIYARRSTSCNAVHCSAFVTSEIATLTRSGNKCGSNCSHGDVLRPGVPTFPQKWWLMSLTRLPLITKVSGCFAIKYTAK